MLGKLSMAVGGVRVNKLLGHLHALLDRLLLLRDRLTHYYEI